MSDFIKHECGIAVVRLLKPLSYYEEKYGTALYGMNKLRLLMQKQRNRGQDGAGLATIKLDMPPGQEYISRVRESGPNYLEALFKKVYGNFKGVKPKKLRNAEWLKANKDFVGEVLMGHLRYGTHGMNAKANCHPFLRKNNWISRNLLLAGNFNLTNVDELFGELVNLGQAPREKSDTITVLEKIGHFLDDEVQRLHTWYKPDGYDSTKINELIFDKLDIQRLLKRASRDFDGGYVMAGLIGHGDAFVMRDPGGIRPAFYYLDDEVAAVASERPALQTAFNVHVSQVKEITPGHALIIKKNGIVGEKSFLETPPRPSTPCSFERIYFSRGTDRDIYFERKKLGERLTEQVLQAVDYDFAHTVHSFVPNTAEASFYGLLKGLENRLNQIKFEQVQALGSAAKPKKLQKILEQRVRMEKLIVKDAKLRTFITEDASRDDLVTHAYDVTYGVVENEVDTIVILDDSIVRGTTLRSSILRMLSRLRPKRIVVVSSAPQIRYPDCYGIDMSKMKDFVAFQALVALLEEHNKTHLLQETYERCKAQEDLPKEEIRNELQTLYAVFTYEQVSDKIAEIICPASIEPEVKVIYQTIEDLHAACPNNNGDWYFSGNYPTAGGNKVVNKAFINYMEQRDERGY